MPNPLYKTCSICGRSYLVSNEHVVTIEIPTKTHRSTVTQRVCEVCASRICDWLASLPNRYASQYSTTARVTGSLEVMDVPITQREYKYLENILTGGDSSWKTR